MNLLSQSRGLADKIARRDRIRRTVMETRADITRTLIAAALALSLAGVRANAQSAHFKDGEYTGDPVQVLWGIVQVKAIVRDGKIADVQFLQAPFDRPRSVEISDYAEPVLKSEAIKAQSAEVDLVSSATETSFGFRQTLASALAKAKK